MRIRFFAALIFATIVVALLGDTSHERQASATPVGVLVWCTSGQENTNTTSVVSVTETCGNAPGDTSGVTVQMTFTQATLRYPLAVATTLTLP